jgi:hypothetical protein
MADDAGSAVTSGRINLIAAFVATNYRRMIETAMETASLRDNSAAGTALALNQSGVMLGIVELFATRTNPILIEPRMQTAR